MGIKQKAFSGIIYKTTNIINGKWYIGKDERNDPSYLGSGVYLNRAIEKYGRKNFIKEIIAEASCPEELSNLEIEFIDRFDATNNPMSYNIAKGGKGGNTLQGMAEEDKIKFSDAIKNSWKLMTVESKNNRLSPMINSTKNKPKTEQHKNKISRAKFGIKQSEETIEKKRKISKELYDAGIICPPRNTWLGKNHSEKSKKKISESKTGVKNYKNRIFTKEDQLEMLRLKENGKRTGEIAELFNTSGPTILRYIREISENL